MVVRIADVDGGVAPAPCWTCRTRRRGTWMVRFFLVPPLLLLSLGCSSGESDDDATSPGPSPTPVPVESPRIEVEPNSLMFGAVEIGDSSDMAVTISNTGTGTLSIEAAISQESVAFALPDAAQVTVPPGDTTSLTVRFMPHEAVGFAATLEISSNDETHPTTSVALAGTGTLTLLDSDQDGWTEDLDCDDSRADVYPGAEEACDDADNDCDGEIDEQVTLTYYPDTDQDGFGDPSHPTSACTPPEGHVQDARDCDDSRADVYPDAEEACDGADNDCDGEIDEDGDTRFYSDTDGDGHGDPAVSVVGCNLPQGYVSSSDDCDDTNPAVHPDATETCNGIDDDCDDGVDEEVTSTFYLDADGDQFGNPAITTEGCEPPPGFVDDSTDCDDGEASVYPGALEVCDEQDNDCDALVDEEVETDYFLDADGDGFGRSSSRTAACSPPTGAYVTESGDCDDLDANAYPGAEELCNGRDDNCDGVADEPSASDAPTWYRDSDDDGFGDASTTAVQCDPPEGYVAPLGDCDDTDPDTYPGAPETCDGSDEDCDGTVDEDPVDPLTSYLDSDGDGFGADSDIQEACDAPDGYVTDNGDCDDGDPEVHPGATEVCNEKDDDCDGDVDGIPECVDTLTESQIVNDYAYLVLDAHAGDTQVALSDTSSFQPGDLVLLVQVQGDPAGQFELAHVETVTAMAVGLTAGLEHDYVAGPYDQFGAFAAQAVRVATYNNLIINGVQITCPAWDGYTGGIIAIRSRYDITFENTATITADAKGFRGPSRETQRASNGRVGEGVLGNSGTRCSTQTTEPDTLTGGCGGIEGTYDSYDGLGGAGGGANALEPPNDAVSYSNRYPAKSGHSYGEGDPGVMIMGGAGGQGDSGSNDWYILAKGGNGGGMIFLWAQSVSGVGFIRANGEAGEASCDYAGYGGDWGASGGGGGAGGSILVSAHVVDGVGLSATGGNGGTVCGHETYHSAAGGMGRIVLDADTISVTTDPDYIQ